MKIRELEIKPAKEIIIKAWECPYCSKKFFNKNSYYNHISKGYCTNFFLDYEIQNNKYKNKLISPQEYYECCYENGRIEFCNISDEEKNQLREDFVQKIESLYDNSQGEYYE